MRQRAFVKLEKKLAIDLKPGEMFILEPELDLNIGSPVIQVFVRTNAPSEGFSDMDSTVYKLHIVIVDPEDPAPPKVNPHSPPGMKDD